MIKRMKRIAGVLMVFLMAAMMAGCNSSSKDEPVYSVGGTVTGLAASDTVVLQNNAKYAVSVQGDGAFTFGTSMANGHTYAVTVKTQPTGKICTVASGSGTIAASNVTNAAVTCTGTITVSGTVEDSISSNRLAQITIVARDTADHTLASATTDTNGIFSVSAPAGQDFYLHADGISIGSTIYVPSNLQIDNRSSDRTVVKFYMTDQASVTAFTTSLGGDSDLDAIFYWDVEDHTGIGGVTVTASPQVTAILYAQTDGSYVSAAPTVAGNDAGGSVAGYLADPGGNGTYTFTLDPDQTILGYTVDTTFRLRLIPGEMSSPYES